MGPVKLKFLYLSKYNLKYGEFKRKYFEYILVLKMPSSWLQRYYSMGNWTKTLIYVTKENIHISNKCMKMCSSGKSKIKLFHSSQMALLICQNDPSKKNINMKRQERCGAMGALSSWEFIFVKSHWKTDFTS